MNYIYIAIIISLIIAFGIYFYFTRKLIRQLIDRAIAFQEAGNKIYEEHRILIDQYRQLAKISEAYRAVSEAKVKILKRK